MPRTQITIDTATALVTFTPKADWKRKKVRAYVDAAEPGMVMPPYGVKGDNAANDAAWRRYNAEERRLMRDAMDVAFRELRATERVFLGDVRATFSRQAGCSCPCSPGFILDTSFVTVDGQEVAAIHVTAKNSPAYARHLEAQRRRAFQAACRFEDLATV